MNGELAHRVQELTRATSDLKNFLESTQIATVFLDNDLRVHELHARRDAGFPPRRNRRRAAHRAYQGPHPTEELFEDVRRVLRTLATTEREITAPDSKTRYMVRILPYRSIDNFIAGVVITLVDVTP